MSFSMRFTKILSLFLLTAGVQFSAKAQLACPVLSGLPDTIRACKGSTVTLPTPSITGIVAGTKFFDSSIYIPGPNPCLGISNCNFNNPFNSLSQSVTVGNISRLVTMKIRTIDTNVLPNGNFSQGVGVGYTTDYTLAPLSANFAGQYDIVSNAQDANPTFASFFDNTTGTAAGKMMAVNGGTDATKAVWSTTVSVTPGRDYTIRYSYAAATGTNPAQLRLRVNGINAGNLVTTVASNPGTWQDFSTIYSNTSATSITVSIFDVTTTQVGNDFALDDVIIQPMCVLKDSTYIQVTDLRPLIQNSQFFGCSEDTIKFKADTTVVGSPATVPGRYFWQFGDGTTDTVKDPVHIYRTQGVYVVRLKVFKDITTFTGSTITCSDSAFAQVDTRHAFNAGFTQDKIRICQGDEVSFTDTSSPAVGLLVTYFSGAGDTSNLESPKFTYADAGIFTVTQIVTDNLGCNDTAYSQVISIGTPKGSFSLTDSTICVGQSIVANAVIDSTFEAVTWDFGDGRIVTDSTRVDHAYLDEGTYTITFTADHPVCPSVTLKRDVTVSPTPRVNLGADTSICPMGQPIYLASTIATNEANTRYRWDNGDSSATRLIRHDGHYYLTAFNDLGCTSVDSIVVARDCYLDIPNVFSPGAEGANAYFLPRQNLSKGLQKFSMKIYDRWGQQVYETNRADGRGWDGRFNGSEQPMGVYIYRIEASFANGATEKYEGNVTLLR